MIISKIKNHCLYLGLFMVLSISLLTSCQKENTMEYLEPESNYTTVAKSKYVFDQYSQNKPFRFGAKPIIEELKIPNSPLSCYKITVEFDTYPNNDGVYLGIIVGEGRVFNLGLMTQLDARTFIITYCPEGPFWDLNDLKNLCFTASEYEDIPGTGFGRNNSCIF